MDIEEFWTLIDTARAGVDDPSDGEAVAARATELLGERDAEEIVGAQRALWRLLADSYRDPLWAAAYTVNGGCSDDGFDYFRGWLIVQGRAVFERVVADPDSLAELAAVRTAATEGAELECEDTLNIAWNAHLAATGADLPADGFRVDWPADDSDWDFDYDDAAEVTRHLPRLAALYLV